MRPWPLALALAALCGCQAAPAPVKYTTGPMVEMHALAPLPRPPGKPCQAPGGPRLSVALATRPRPARLVRFEDGSSAFVTFAPDGTWVRTGYAPAPKAPKADTPAPRGLR